MKTFFDVLCFTACGASVIAVMLLLVRFPAKIRSIDCGKNKKNISPERYRRRVFYKQTLLVLLVTVLLFVPAVVGLMGGSATKETDDPRVVVPVVVMFAGMFAGGIALGAYYGHVGKKYGIFQREDNADGANAENAAEYSELPPFRNRAGESRTLFTLGIITAFYFFLTVGFALFDLVFLL